MKNKTFINIQPQEVTEGGERSVRYKGSDGKFHSVAPDGGSTALSVEEVTRTVELSMASTITAQNKGYKDTSMNTISGITDVTIRI